MFILLTDSQFIPTRNNSQYEKYFNLFYNYDSIHKL